MSGFYEGFQNTSDTVGLFFNGAAMSLGKQFVLGLAMAWQHELSSDRRGVITAQKTISAGNNCTENPY